MFQSFFPTPKYFFGSFFLWSILAIGAWYGFFHNFHGLNIGNLIGITDQSTLDGIWFYQYMVSAIIPFTAFWMKVGKTDWVKWSVGGSALIVFVNWLLVHLDLMINGWFGSFYDMVQSALGNPGSVAPPDFYWQFVIFLKIALTYVFISTLFRFFVSHFVFRWRTAMNSYYMSKWSKFRHIEGASQRIQEDTMRFAMISEDLGVSLLDSIMTLIAFLPLLWVLSDSVKYLPIVGEVDQGLVFVAIIWSIIGTTVVGLSGIKLPGLEFNKQKVEAAYRKELVYGEDDNKRAAPPTIKELFSDIRKNYFRLYLNYMYFNMVRIFYLQFGALVPYVALAPSILTGVISLGVMQQIIRAFTRVETSFQYLVNSWSTIVELMSIHKRLKAFENEMKSK